MDCVDKGAPECANGTIDACEVCEEDDQKDCVEVDPTQFSGGKATCAALEVTSEVGSTCDFHCTGGGSQCPKADCQAGASCTFDCSDHGNCNDPTCADGACSGH